MRSLQHGSAASIKTSSLENRELGTAFLVVIHDPRLAERCDRIIELVDGRVRTDVRR